MRNELTRFYCPLLAHISLDTFLSSSPSLLHSHLRASVIAQWDWRTTPPFSSQSTAFFGSRIHHTLLSWGKFRIVLQNQTAQGTEALCLDSWVKLSSIHLVSHHLQQLLWCIRWDEQVEDHRAKGFSEWCKVNQLHLNIRKTKEIVVDFRRWCLKMKLIHWDKRQWGQIPGAAFIWSQGWHCVQKGPEPSLLSEETFYPQLKYT